MLAARLLLALDTDPSFSIVVWTSDDHDSLLVGAARFSFATHDGDFDAGQRIGCRPCLDGQHPHPEWIAQNGTARLRLPRVIDDGNPAKALIAGNTNR